MAEVILVVVCSALACTASLLILIGLLQANQRLKEHNQLIGRT